MKPLFEHRSYAGCIACSILFLAEKAGMVLRVMLPYYIIIAALTTIYMAINTWANVNSIVGIEIPISAFLASITLAICIILIYFIATGRLMLLLRRLYSIEQQGSKTWKRSLRLAALAIPKATKFLLKSHAIGKIILTTVISLFLCTVLSLMLYLPIVICTSAFFSSIEASVNFGDNANIPVSGLVLIFLVCTLSITGIHFIFTLHYTTWLHLWASIKTRITNTTQNTQPQQ